MRIISGKYKGRRIFPPKNLPVRPTTDMSKEALFNVLNNHFHFDSLKDFDIAATKSDVFKFLENSKSTYDIIFADPPYGLDQATFEKIVLTVFERDLLEEDGMMIIEHSKYTKLDHMINFSFQKSYGGSYFSFFELNSTDDDEELPHDVSKKESEEDEG